jgi:hypothetical protein
MHPIPLIPKAASMALITRGIHITMTTTGPFSMGRTGSTDEAVAIQGRYSMGRIGRMGEAAAIRVVALATTGADRADK